MKKNYLLACGLLFGTSLFAQQNSPASDDNSVTIIPCTYFGISRPLRELFTEEEEVSDIKKKESEDRKHRKAQTFVHKAEDGPEYGEDMSVRQTVMGTRTHVNNGTRSSSPGVVASFGGQTGGGYPPDPSGAAGPNHYVQAVNATPFKCYNKSTGAGIGTVKQIGSLWSPAVGNLGDPIIMYDRYADRWFLSQFGSGNQIYIAISTTNDPTGTYYTYTYISPDFPDYLKFSIWWDGYYMTANYGEKVFCFERDQMLIGTPTARGFSKTFSTATGGGFFLPMPGDADGGLPASGTPLPFFQYTDNAWGGGATDAIKIFKMTTTWGSTPSATIAVDATVALSAFDASYDFGWNDISQPGTSAKLDGIGGILQFRAPWRKWTGYNSVVLNFPVKLSSTQRSIRWCELRQDQTTGTWSLYQESTYAPDAHSRWVGSIAMDDNGHIALCYAKASTSVSASLAYTGRLASDPLGTMTFAENVVRAGSGAQTATNRFGDYSQTTLDPDGVTFWHTGEYLQSGAPRTWIYSFTLAGAIGINETANPTELVVYQNGGLLNIKASNLSVDGELSLDLFDSKGALLSNKMIVANGTNLESSFDVSALAEGTYIVRLGKMNTSFQKVVKVVLTK